MSNPKILCPAPSKMGTVSLTAALEALGYRIAHYPHGQEIAQSLMTGEEPADLLYRVDGMTDLPASIWYRDLLKRYPGSVIIMVVRGTSEWLESMTAHYAKNPPKQANFDIHDMLRVRFYGVNGINKRKWVNRLFALLGELNSIVSQYPTLWLDLRDNNDELLNQLTSFLQKYLNLSDERIAEARRNGLTEFPHLNKTRR